MIEQPVSEQPQTLAGKVAIITGASYGLGRETAKVFAARGAKVVVTGRTVENLESLRDEIRATGAEIEIVPGDVGVREEVDRTVQTAVDAFGGVDALANNAQSLEFDKPVLELDDEGVMYPMRSGLFGTLYFMQACHAPMKARGGGSIINYGSAVDVRGMAGFGAYAMTKGAVRALTRVAATEWGPDNIRVNLILPSGLTEGAREHVEAHPEMLEQLRTSVPLGRIGDPALDIGAAVAALASDELRFLTGATLSLDGGSFYIS
jgi:NAD(P)-dependent dehydrogenase (short-subunit alcohol dehydrogenase family)